MAMLGLRLEKRERDKDSDAPDGTLNEDLGSTALILADSL